MDKVISEMTLLIKESVGKNWSNVKPSVDQFINRRRVRLALLAELILNKEITEQEFESRLIDEKKVGEAEFHAIAVIAKVNAQLISNKAIDIFHKAIIALIKGAI